MEKYGVQKTTEAIIGIANFVNALSKALADGKFSFGEAFTVLPTLMPFAQIFGEQGIEELKKELGDLSPAEVDTVNKEFAAYFDIANDEAEAKIEQVLAWATYTYGTAKTVFG